MRKILNRNYYIGREAKELKYRHLKKSTFHSHGQYVYEQGNSYITYDIYGHKGGFWKMYKRRIKSRIGTFNLDLSIRVGV
jgi:hypothetical protein